MPLPLTEAIARMTGQQLAALSTQRDRWIAVEAGAGAGKTAVLSSRVLLLLEQGVELKRIVAITFTRKAAAEMSGRVLRLLSERILELESFARSTSVEADFAAATLALKHLRRAREEFHAHRISTIDRFCRAGLAAHAIEAELDPGFGMMDEKASARALDEALDELILTLSQQVTALERDEPLDEQWIAQTHAFAKLNDLLSSRDVRSVLRASLLKQDDILAAVAPYGDLNSEAGQRAYLEHARELAELAWQDFRRNIAKQAQAMRDACSAVVANHPDNKRAVPLLALLDALESDSLEESHFTYPGGGHGKPWNDSPIAFTDTTDFAKLVKEAWEARAIGEMAELQSAAGLGAIATLLPWLVGRYDELKRGNLDFADLKRYFSAFLESDDHAQSVADGIDYLMIDEFQDTDPAQWGIFSRILEAGKARDDAGINLFVVGDEKQSIYRFRGADVSIFQAARDAVRAHNLDAKSQQAPTHPCTGETLTKLFADSLADKSSSATNLNDPGALAHEGVVTLTGNFRTRPALLEIGNAIFEEVFALRSPDGEVARDALPFDARAAAMTPGLKIDDGLGTLDVLPLPALSTKGESTPSSEGEQSGYRFDPARAEAQAMHCAHYIRDVLNRDNNIDFEKIAVLLRTRTPLRVLKAAFAARGVPYCVPDGNGLLQTQEAFDLWALCAGLSEAEDDLAIAALLRSPMVGLSDSGMTLLVRSWERDVERGGRRAAKLDTLWQSQAQWPTSLSAIDRARLVDGLAWLNKWRALAGRISLRELLSNALAECGAWAHGVDAALEQRAANLTALLALADNFEAEHGPSLPGFAEELLARMDDGDEESEAMPEGSASGVRVMTIHASKGKEFDAVVLPFIDQRSGGFGSPLVVEAGAAVGRARDPKRPLIGLRTKIYAQAEQSPDRPISLEMLNEATKLEERAELRRVAYVAFTRARKHLALILQTIESKKEIRTNPESASTLDRVLQAASGIPMNLNSLEEDASTWSAWLQSRCEKRGVRFESLTPESFDTKALAALRILPLPDQLTQHLESAAPLLALSQRLRELALEGNVAIDAPGRELRYAQPLIAPKSVERVAASRLSFSTQTRSSEPLSAAFEVGVIPALPAGSAALFGEVVHAMLERYARGERSPDWSRLAREEAERMGLIKRKLDVEPDEIEMGVLSLAESHAENAAKALGELPARDKLGVEMELGFMLAERHVSATPDLVFEREADVWRVVDYKTGSVRGYQSQLELYALGLARYLQAAGAPPKRVETALISTLSGELIEVASFDADGLAALEAEWVNALRVQSSNA